MFDLNPIGFCEFELRVGNELLQWSIIGKQQ
jgi:hypothetical protein